MRKDGSLFIWVVNKLISYCINEIKISSQSRPNFQDAYLLDGRRVVVTAICTSLCPARGPLTYTVCILRTVPPPVDIALQPPSCATREPSAHRNARAEGVEKSAYTLPCLDFRHCRHCPRREGCLEPK